MKIFVPEIAAHIEQNGVGRNEEILSVDFHPVYSLFATAGGGENQGWHFLSCDITP
jgi:hypothetical protein